MIRITSTDPATGKTVEEVVIFVDPPTNFYHHVDVDGDRLALNPARLPDGRTGVNITTDPSGSTLLLADIPAFIEALQELQGDG